MPELSKWLISIGLFLMAIGLIGEKNTEHNKQTEIALSRINLTCGRNCPAGWELKYLGSEIGCLCYEIKK